MNIGLIEVLGGIAIAVAIFFGGWYCGGAVHDLKTAQEHVTDLDHVIVKQQIIIKEVPKIVTKVVTKEVTVEKEVERVVTVANSMLAPDCVLPEHFGMLLVAAANGIDPAARVPDEIAGKYGCRETLAAVLSDLRSGWKNTARLEGLQQYEKVITGERSKEGATP